MFGLTQLAIKIFPRVYSTISMTLIYSPSEAAGGAGSGGILK
jgi:hypothetical protein